MTVSHGKVAIAISFVLRGVLSNEDRVADEERDVDGVHGVVHLVVVHAWLAREDSCVLIGEVDEATTKDERESQIEDVKETEGHDPEVQFHNHHYRRALLEPSML